MKLDFRSKKGAISLFALLSMLFFLVFLLGIFTTISIRDRTQTETLTEIREIYKQKAELIYDLRIADQDYAIIPIYTRDQLAAVGKKADDTGKIVASGTKNIYWDINGKVYNLSNVGVNDIEIKTPIYLYNKDSNDTELIDKYAGLPKIIVLDATASILNVVITPPQRKLYTVGEGLILAGGRITITYRDKSVEIEPLTADMITGFTTSTIGDYVAKIKYENVTVDYAYKVVAASDFYLADGSWDAGRGVNSPRLVDGMIAVYWASNTNGDISSTPSNNTVEITQNNANFKWANWYDYVAQTGTADGRTSRWANAKMEADGSYWVWIPRFAYRITALLHNGPAATTRVQMNVIFIDVDNINGATKYYSTPYPSISGSGTTMAMSANLVHPAFSADITKGGWDYDLPGIWVAKFVMSMESLSGSTWNATTTTSSNGNVTTDAAKRVVSKPGVAIWRYINIGNMYTNSYNYDRTKESHLMKNSEWGAAAYLTASQYGRNGNRTGLNNTTGYITGYGAAAGTASTTNTTTAANLWNGTTGRQMNSTGNMYGIYDMSGGVSEAVASFVDNGHANLTHAVTAITSGGVNLYNNKDSKYIMYYSKGTANTESITSNYTASGYNVSTGKWGDAIYETSSESTSNTTIKSWFANFSGFPASADAFIMRGGSAGDASNATNSARVGIFAFQGFNGSYNATVGYRVVLCP